MTVNYERIVQWVAGPFAMATGVAATKLVEHLTFLGQVGLKQSAVAHAIVVAVTFGVTTLVTYAAHHKWLSNLAKWWTVAPSVSATPVVSNTPSADASRADALRAQVRSMGGVPGA